MKKRTLSLAMLSLMAVMTAGAQTMNVVTGDVTYHFNASQTGDMNYTGGNTLTIQGKAFSIGDIDRIYIADGEFGNDSVFVTYNGSSAHVDVSGNIAAYVTPLVSGAHVSIAQADGASDEIAYSLTGTSTDGEFYMTGSYKSTIELNGLTLTNTTPVYSGAAVNIQNGKRINVKVITGTVNALTDAATGSQKACLYIKGHAEFKQKGTLNVTGNLKHAIKAGEYITIKNSTINVLSAVADGLNCEQYFLMESGSLNIKGTGDDGIQCDIEGTTSTGTTDDHDNEDSGNIYISGGDISITSTAAGAKGIKADGSITVTDGNITVTSSGKGTWDSDDSEAKGTSCVNADGNITIGGGTLTLTNTGAGGKGIRCDSLLTVTGGTITVKTSGGLYYSNGSTENTNYSGNTDRLSDNYYASPKGIKAGIKGTTVGGVVISGGNINVTTSGTNAEGIESKNTLEISGGQVTVNAYDDAINSAQDLTISGGMVYARATNNDGIDANGNCYIKGGLIYAIGTSQPEVAIDANTEQNKQLYFSGGTLVAIGGLESGSSLTQACYQSSSWTRNTWYALTYGDSTFAFQTPASAGSTLVVSAATQPTLKSGVTVSSGTEIFGGAGYVNATVSGGSSVTLSSYTSGGGNNPGGGGDRPGGGGGPGGGGHGPGGW